MHELALAEGVLAVVLDAADGRQVRCVRLQVGTLLMIVPDSLQFSFQLLAEGTPADGAVLQMEETVARWRCKQCSAESRLDLPPFSCQSCGAYEVEIVSGDELVVDAVVLEQGVTIRRRAVQTEAILEEHLMEHERRDDKEHAGDAPHLQHRRQCKDS